MITMTVDDCGCKRVHTFLTVALGVDYAVSYIEAVLGYDRTETVQPCYFRMRESSGEIVGFVALHPDRTTEIVIGPGHPIAKEYRHA